VDPSEQISESYKNAAKDFNSTGTSNNSLENPTIKSKFEAVSEAYVVLTNPGLRAEYDSSDNRLRTAMTDPLQRKKKELARTIHGTLYSEGSTPTTYHQELNASLTHMRKAFNVDEFGRFKGGLPNKTLNSIRGRGHGYIGQYMPSTEGNRFLNMKTEGNIEQHITPEEVEKFQNYQNIHRQDLSPWVWFKADVDYDFISLKGWWPYLRNFRNAFLMIFVAGLFSGCALRANKRELEEFYSVKEDELDAE